MQFYHSHRKEIRTLGSVELKPLVEGLSDLLGLLLMKPEEFMGTVAMFSSLGTQQTIFTTGSQIIHQGCM